MPALKNNNLALICGVSGAGKSASLRELEIPEGVIYLNCESNKELPFASHFKHLTITDPMQVFQAFDQAEKMPDIHTIVVDSLTFLMDMVETKMVVEVKDTQKGWGNFQQYFKKLMQHYVAKSSKNIFFTAHIATTLNDQNMELETKVPIKGALKNNGVEAYFGTVITAKKVPLKVLDDYQNDMLIVTEDEQDIGYKHVFQTRLTKDTINERIRSGMGMWSKNETFIDNNLQFVINKLHEYYGTKAVA